MPQDTQAEDRIGARVHRRILLFGIITLAAGIIVGGYALTTGGRDSVKPGPPLPIRIASSTSENAALVWIAEDRGFFSDAGLEVTITEQQFGRLAGEAVLSGEADVGTVSEFVLTKAAFSHDDLRLLASMAASDTIGLVSSKDRGIQAAADVKGKRVAVTPGTTGEFFFDQFLLLNEIARESVAVVPMRPGGMREAMESGDVDAAFTWQPFVHSISASLGERGVVLPGQSGQRYHFLLMPRADWVKSQPLAIKRLLKALLRAEEFAAQQPAAAQEIMQRRFGRDPGYLSAVWNSHDLRISLPQTLLPILEGDAQWLIGRGLVKGEVPPDFLSMLYFDGMEAVNPTAVTVIR